MGGGGGRVPSTTLTPPSPRGPAVISDGCQHLQGGKGKESAQGPKTGISQSLAVA